MRNRRRERERDGVCVWRGWALASHTRVPHMCVCDREREREKQERWSVRVVGGSCFSYLYIDTYTYTYNTYSYTYNTYSYTQCLICMHSDTHMNNIFTMNYTTLGVRDDTGDQLVGCSVLQCVAVCCSVLQCVAVGCSVSQCVAV